MKTKIQTIVLITLLGVTFAAGLHAQLPNAWQINDGTSSFGLVEYLTNLTTARMSAANSNGWRYDVVSRLVSSSTNGSQGMVVYDGTRRFYIFFGLNTSGQLTAQLLGGATYTVTSATEGVDYHTNELTYDPATSNATYRVDGTVIATWPGQNFGGNTNQVMWGANYSAGLGVMNYHHAEFDIIGQGVIADYDAGVAGNPAVAPAPTTRGWTRYASGAALSEGPISPDRGPDVVTSLADSGYGSLRETIADARPGDTITFFTNGVITLTSGELLIAKNLTVTGPGATNLTISGNDASRVFEITNANLTLGAFTLTHGQASVGGGIEVDAGAALTLNNATLADSSASVGGGGGILSDGALTLNNCTLSANSAVDAGGGIYLFIDNNDMCLFTNTIVAGNTAYNHPDIYASYAALSVANSLLSGNPLLAPLGNYGGPTQTMPPLAGSPAIDAGRDSVTSFLTSDQRGYPRKSGAHVDIGAVEAQYAPANNRPQLTGSAFSTAGGANSFQFNFTNAADADFTVLASTNLALPLTNWVEIGNATQYPPGQYQFTDPGATNYPQRFYQVVSP